MQLHPFLLLLLRRILKGDASPAEVESFNTWYDALEEEVVFLDDVKGRQKEEIEEELLLKVKAKIQKSPVETRPFHSRIYIRIISAAAILVLGFTCGAFLLSRYISAPTERPATGFKTFVNGKGVIKKILLPDGSKASLFHDTELEVAENFSENRYIILRGEAFFEVKKDSIHPFTVQSTHLSTEVMGTSFIIQSRAEGDRVAVKTGLVSVSDHQNNDLIEAGFQLEYNGSEMLVKTIDDEENLFGWTERKLVWRNVAMDEMVRSLESWYGVTISHDLNPSTTCRISGSYKDMSLEHVLELIRYSIPITYQLRGDHLDIQFPHCPHPAG